MKINKNKPINSSIPTNWKVVKGKEVFIPYSGNGNPSQYNLEGDTLFLKVSDFNLLDRPDKIDRSTLKFLKLENPKIRIIPKNSIVFPKRGASIFLNKIGILSSNAAMDSNLMALIVIEDNDSWFMRYQLEFINLSRFADTTSVPQINNKHIYPLEIIKPSLLEQKKIAAILSSVDHVIETTQDAIAQLQIVKRGLMQQLLTKGILGLNKDWEQVRLFDVIADLTSGVSVKGEDRIKTNKEIAVLKASAVYEGKFLPNEHKTIVDQKEQKRAKINPKKDHIIISRSNTLNLVGQSGYVEQDYPNLYLPDKLWQVILKNSLKTHTKWLAYFINYLQKNG